MNIQLWHIFVGIIVIVILAYFVFRRNKNSPENQSIIDRSSENKDIDIEAAKPVSVSDSSEDPSPTQQLSREDQVDLAIALLKSGVWSVRRDTARKVSELNMSMLGVIYELVNNLADDYKEVREESSKALINVKARHLHWMLSLFSKCHS